MMDIKILKYLSIWLFLVSVSFFCANYKAPSNHAVHKAKDSFTLISSSYFIGKNCVSAESIKRSSKKLPVCFKGSRKLIGVIKYTNLEDVTGADLESIGKSLVMNNISTNNRNQLEL